LRKEAYQLLGKINQQMLAKNKDEEHHCLFLQTLKSPEQLTQK